MQALCSSHRRRGEHADLEKDALISERVFSSRRVDAKFASTGEIGSLVMRYCTYHVLS